MNDFAGSLATGQPPAYRGLSVDYYVAGFLATSR